MTIAVMQPYFLPYIGYFQLINAADKFVFYDDVSFIKGGWINRNLFKISSKKSFITVPCKGISSSKKINEIEVNLNQINRDKILRSIEQSYKKSPNFEQVFELFRRIIDCEAQSISRFSANSVVEVSNYLGLGTEFYFSSELAYNHSHLDRSIRLIEMVKLLKGKTYINPLGGQHLYSKEDFETSGLILDFIAIDNKFFLDSGLESILDFSIIDVLMNESIVNCKSYLSNYITY
jgi:hypothetical protein